MNSMGYVAIVFLMFLENVFPPIPSELIMPLAGYTATQGKLTFAGVVIAGMLGSVLGALPLYYAGKIIGHERLKTWADKHGKWLTVSSDDIDKAKDWFERHGSKAVFFARLVPGVRSLISVPAGIACMPMPIFLLWTALGTGIWAGVLAYFGLLLGENYDRVEKYMSPATYVVLGLIVAVYIYRVVQQSRAQKTA
jgi:membrane protein DedA with SNARE-associated domain